MYLHSCPLLHKNHLKNPIKETTMAFKQHLGSRGAKNDRIFWSGKAIFLALVALKVTSETDDQLSPCNNAEIQP